MPVELGVELAPGLAVVVEDWSEVVAEPALLVELGVELAPGVVLDCGDALLVDELLLASGVVVAVEPVAELPLPVVPELVLFCPVVLVPLLVPACPGVPGLVELLGLVWSVVEEVELGDVDDCDAVLPLVLGLVPVLDDD